MNHGYIRPLGAPPLYMYRMRSVFLPLGKRYVREPFCFHAVYMV